MNGVLEGKAATSCPVVQFPHALLEFVIQELDMNETT